ncbi:DNA repair protein RecO, partial [candidate division WWE3 bacterium]|nr:DNA repair protein RecO [candidate division WWE3 bacterium]
MYKCSEGIVLKVRNHKEADKIVTLYTKKEGKMDFLAKGVRRINSRRSGSLDIINKIKFEYVSGQFLPVITEVEFLESFRALKKNLESLSYG